MARRTKVSRVLSFLVEKADCLRTGPCVNGFSGRLLAEGPFRGSVDFRWYSSTAAAASTESRVGLGGFEVLGLKDYEEYRKALYGEITHKAILVDAVGTLLVPSQPMAQVCILGFCGIFGGFLSGDRFFLLHFLFCFSGACVCFLGKI